MMHAARKAFYERIRKETQSPEEIEKRRESTQKKIIAHKYGISGNTKKEGMGR